MFAQQNTLTQFVNFNEELIIPFFQRSYVWDEEQWERLVADLKYASSTQRAYFMGAIILKALKNQYGQTTGNIVIDGQQRLTTLAIFFKALCHITGQTVFFNNTFKKISGAPVIKQSHSCASDFEKVMNLTQSEDLTDYGESNIIRAYNYFRRVLIDIYFTHNNRDENGQQILSSDNLHFLMNFVVMRVDEAEDEQQIFDTINSLGVKLSTGELLKNYLFDNTQIDYYNAIWRSTFEADDECLSFWEKTITTGRLNKKNIEVFIYYYLQIKAQQEGIEIDRKQYRRWENLFSSYKELIRTNHLVKTSIAKEITEYAEIFRQTFSPEQANEDIPSEFGLKRINFIVQNLDSSTIIPYVLYVIKTVKDDEEKGKIFGYLEKYLVRRLICNAKNANYSDLFTENLIGQGINSYSKLVDYFKTKDSTSSLAMPSDAKVAFGFTDTPFKNNKRALAILYLLESKIRTGMHSTKLYTFDGYSLEHLMPKKWKKYWTVLPEGVTPEERDKRIFTLGNMAMITAGLNSSISNSDWSTKKSGKNGNSGLSNFATGIETMYDTLTREVWDENSISERAAWLAQKANVIWNID